MADLVLLLVSGLVTALVLDRKYRMLSISHAVLFVSLLVFYFFATDFAPIASLAEAWIGEQPYEFLHSALNDGLLLLSCGVNAFVMIELGIYVVASIAAFVVLVHAYRKLFRRIRFAEPPSHFHCLASAVVALTDPHRFAAKSQRTYLLLSRLRN